LAGGWREVVPTQVRLLRLGEKPLVVTQSLGRAALSLAGGPRGVAPPQVRLLRSWGEKRVEKPRVVIPSLGREALSLAGGSRGVVPPQCCG
jgi:hypothetical protein